MIEIKGIVERIIYRNEDNGYSVFLFKTEDDIITVSGSCIEIKTSCEYEIKGDFTYHKKYGEQFALTSMKEILPTSKNGIMAYLSSGVIKGVGEKTAKLIVDKFKEDTLEVLENEPEKLLSIYGIGEKKLQIIVDSVNENRGLKNIVLFLANYNIGTNLAFKVFKEYKDDAIKIIKENPYRLAEDIRGIGFKKADEIALKLGDFRNSSIRKAAAIKHTLSMASLEGHCFLEVEELIRRTQKLIASTREDLLKEINSLRIDDRFIVENYKGATNCYYAPYLRAENYVSGKLKELCSYEFEKRSEDELKDKIKKIEERLSINLAENQKKAVKAAVDDGILIISGGPGTGKTTTLKAIIEVFESMQFTVKLAAPTGRAAKRMSEATGRESSTIHKLLELGFGNDEQINYGYEEESVLDCDVLIVDEMSMVDLMLMNTLLKSIKIGTRLIFVGDKDQLPSVGAGNVLSDMIKSKRIPIVNLDKIFRQEEESLIIKNSHLINKGMLPEISNSGDFFMIVSENEKETLKTIKELVSKRLPDYYSIDSKNIQVLTPMKKGIVGVYNINKELQSVLNPSGKEIKFQDRIFRVNDRVMQTKNNYQLEYKIESSFYLEEGEGVFNGDIGYITDIDEDEKSLTVLYDGVKSVKYEREDMDELLHSYACTIHKSQGSEFEVVVIPIHFAPYILLTKNLLYTGVTRAKKIVVLVGDYKYLDIMVKNNKETKRYSNLASKIGDLDG